MGGLPCGLAWARGPLLRGGDRAYSEILAGSVMVPVLRSRTGNSCEGTRNRGIRRRSDIGDRNQAGVVPRRRRRGGDDADGDSLVIGSVTQPDGGTVLITGDTTLTYEPDLGFCDEGPDMFTYTRSTAATRPPCRSRCRRGPGSLV